RGPKRRTRAAQHGDFACFDCMHASYPKKATPHGRNARLSDLPHQQIFFTLPHFATGSQKHRDPRFPPCAFTEHGAIMAATVLNSPGAIEMSIYVVRAFVKLRELLASNKDLGRKLAALERSLEALDLKTQRQFKEVYEAIRALMNPPQPKRRSIGFTADLGEK